MKFLCDVHISYKVVKYLGSIGFEAIHVNEILNKWFTHDKDICNFADKKDLIVITKDSDFRDSFYINGTPKKLIKLNLGNISNTELIQILSKNINQIQKIAIYKSFIIEVDKEIINFNVPDNQ